MYLSIFARTAGALALTVFLAAQALDWSDQERIVASGTIVAFGLLAAVIGGLVAVGWAFVGTPAVTPLGKALRSAVQALVAAPLAAVVITNVDDFATVGDMLLPTAAAVVLAFLVSYFSNRNPAPNTEAKPVGADFVGTA